MEVKKLEERQKVLVERLQKEELEIADRAVIHAEIAALRDQIAVKKVVGLFSRISAYNSSFH